MILGVNIGVCGTAGLVSTRAVLEAASDPMDYRGRDDSDRDERRRERVRDEGRRRDQT